MANIVINTDTKISHHVIFNTGATSDHNCIIEDYCHIAPGCFLCGQTKLGAGDFVGVGTNVCPAVKIGAQTLSGAGSVVFKSLPSCCFAYGNPAKIIQTNYSQ